MRRDLTGGWLGLSLLIGFAGLIAWLASAAPSAKPTSAALDQFSSGRAFGDIAAMASRPHPVGSSENARVRDQLVVRLTQLGLSPQIQRLSGVRPWGGRSQSLYTIENVIARFPGVDSAAPALLVMSHYDSVPRSPGAADDMAGVASALELVRLLKQTPKPARDVLFVFTDGEEAGLLGAEAFFAHSSDAARVGFMVNMETRGGGGRALMFQTSAKSGSAERLFAATAIHPQSNSLAAFIYTKMPNDTDFSVALAQGVPGFNYAFIGRPQLYHTPAATPGAVDPGSVQSLGEQVWAVVNALAHAPTLPPRTPGLIWFDLFGGVVIAYPPALGWLPVGLGALLLGFSSWRLRRIQGLTFSDLAMGVGQSLAATTLAGALLFLYGKVAVTGYYQALSHPWRTEIVIAMAVLAASFLVFRIGKAAPRPDGRWLGVVFLGWVIGAGLQLAAPPMSYLAAWPVALAAGALALPYGPQPSALSRAVGFILCAVALGFLLESWHVVILGIALTLPSAGAGLLPLALAPLAPFLQGERVQTSKLPRPTA